MRARTRLAMVVSVILLIAIGVASYASSAASGAAATSDVAQARMARDLAAGHPIVVHVIVALCDNDHQGIVPVPRHLGNGQSPRGNLYWGAMYGVQTFFSKQAGWTTVPSQRPVNQRILERTIFSTRVTRDTSAADVYVVADAWDGAEIRSAIEQFLAMTSGGATETIAIRRDATERTITAGGASHVIAFVGHNGLMDFSVRGPQQRVANAGASSSIVLACASKPYFLDMLRAGGSHPLLLTTGLMAPEAYTLDAAIRSWIGGARTVTATREAAATAYHQHQKCGLTAARRLFWGDAP